MLEKLITEGEQVRRECDSRGETCSHLLGDGYTSENYAKFIAKSILFLEKNYPGQTLTSTFIRASSTAIGWGGADRLDVMTGILKAIREFESESK